MLMKSFSSTALGVKLNFIKNVVIRSFSFQTFHYSSFDKLKKDDVT